MNRCDGCAHWTRLTGFHKAFGACNAVDHYIPGREYGVEPLPAGPMVIDADDDPYVVSRLITRPGFSCALWEAKD